jgi:hypothetical protein
MLAAAPGLSATTLLEEIHRRYSGQYDDAPLEVCGTRPSDRMAKRLIR